VFRRMRRIASEGLNETANEFFRNDILVEDSTCVGYDSQRAATVGLQRKTVSVNRLRPFPRFQAE
jgi:hypothetical protein